MTSVATGSATGLRGRLLLLGLGSALLGLLLAGLAGLLAGRDLRDAALRDAMAGALVRADTAIGDASAAMHATAAALARRPDVAAALAAGDAAPLRAALADAFETLPGGRLAWLDATDAAGRLLARAADPAAMAGEA
ncbi:hypothetical protein E2C05_19740, partial [Paracraurococcus ruber]